MSGSLSRSSIDRSAAVSGRPLHNALVWQDTRTQGIISALDDDTVALLHNRTGLRASTYFSGSKMKVRHAIRPPVIPAAASVIFQHFMCSGS